MRCRISFIFWGIVVVLLGATSNGRAQQPTYEWAVSLGTTGHDSGEYVGTDAAGNVYMAGLVRGPGPTSMQDIYVAKYDPRGQVLWTQWGSGQNLKTLADMAVDAAGNVVLTGFYTAPSLPPSQSSALTFGQVALTRGSMYGEMLIVKYDSLGNVLWANQTVGQGLSGTRCAGEDLALDTDGSVYLTGSYGGASGIRFNHLTTATTAYAHFLVKYDAQGTPGCAKTWATAGIP